MPVPLTDKFLHRRPGEMSSCAVCCAHIYNNYGTYPASGHVELLAKTAFNISAVCANAIAIYCVQMQDVLCADAEKIVSIPCFIPP